MRRVPEPHTDLVALVPHRNHSAVDVLAVVVEGLPDETEHHLEPEVVEAPNPLFLVQVDEPPVQDSYSRIGWGIYWTFRAFPITSDHIYPFI